MMMEQVISPIDMQQAWQTAFQLRTCPSDTVLRSKVPDENLERHLDSCSNCREKRNMPAEHVDAWQKLFDKFAPQIHQAVSAPQPGQVWVLSKKLSRWGDDGYYYSPPNVLLLGKLNDGKGFRAAQLYSDRRLMGEGDVWLGDRFGFAQAWNTYVFNQDAIECWLGNAKDSQVIEVINAGALAYAPMEENSILSFFRKMEIAVGKNVSVAACNLPVIESFLESIFGSLADAYDKLKKFKLPEYADSLLGLLSSARDPHAITPVVAATSIPLQVNVIIKQQNGAITINTVGAMLTESNWDDGDYYITGKLKEIQQEDLFLVASLNVDGSVVCECQSSIERGSPYFDIVFKSVAKEASSIENLKFILVKP
jgi:hypothetical protein